MLQNPTNPRCGVKKSCTTDVAPSVDADEVVGDNVLGRGECDTLPPNGTIKKISIIIKPLINL